jgi:hypothetical protein
MLGHVLLALLSVLGTEPVHEWLHHGGRLDTLSGAPELHDGSCKDVTDVGPVHGICPVCSMGRAPLSPAGAAVSATPCGGHAVGAAPTAAERLPPPVLPAGVLGARGPPAVV